MLTLEVPGRASPYLTILVAMERRQQLSMVLMEFRLRGDKWVKLRIFTLSKAIPKMYEHADSLLQK
jgi:hypothetical protein